MEKEEKRKEIQRILKEQEERKSLADKAFRKSKFFRFSFIYRIVGILLFGLFAFMHFKVTHFTTDVVTKSSAQCYRDEKTNIKKTEFHVEFSGGKYDFGLLECRSNYFEIGSELKIHRNWISKPVTIQGIEGPEIYCFSYHYFYIGVLVVILLSFFFRYGHERISKKVIFVSIIIQTLGILGYLLF